MRKVISVILITLYFFGATDAYQLLKVPNFFAHYKIHKTENPDISIIDFIQIHYSGFLVIDADYEEDMQLPFKTTQEEFSVSANIILPPRYSMPLKRPENIKPVYSDLKAAYPPNFKVEPIFQPPRFTC